MIRLLMLLIVLGLVWYLLGFLPLPTLLRVVIVLCLTWELLAITTQHSIRQCNSGCERPGSSPGPPDSL